MSANSTDRAAAALQQAAATADDVAAENREIARQARAMSRARSRGATASELIEAGIVKLIVEALRESSRQLATVARVIQQAIVAALSSEGFTTRDIGQRLGVSHQHVSTLRARGR